jgi:hypothetical protein
MVNFHSIRNRRHILAILTGLAFSTVPSAQTVATNHVLLIFDEQKVPDHYRARLFDLLTKAIPAPQWKTHTITPADKNLDTLIKNEFAYYDGAKSNGGGYPETMEVIRNAIRLVNGRAAAMLPIGSTIKIPPVPMSGYATYGYKPSLSHFDPRSGAYWFVGQLRQDITTLTGTIGSRAENDQRRNTTLRMVELDVTDTLRQLVSEPLTREALAKSVVIVSADSKDNVLRAVTHQSSPAPCSTSVDWLPTSRYFSLWQTLRPKIDTSSTGNLLATAKAHPFVIVDWNTGPTVLGHGSKVVAVAKNLLHTLTLDDLAECSDCLQSLDLNPNHNGKALSALLDSFLSSKTIDTANIPKMIQDSRVWVNSNVPARDKPDSDMEVDELIIQAVTWQLFNKSTAYVNMSFQVFSPALNLAPPMYFVGSQSFGTAAAGDSFQVNPGTFPQFVVSTYPTLTNVTYGTQDGTILGPTSSTVASTPVHLVAPGCGFSFGPITVSDRGTSFASPYVGAAAWVKSLLQPSITVETMRSRLVLASRPLSPPMTGILSGGLFDAALLLAAPGAHAVDIHNNVIPLASATGSLSFTTASGSQELQLTGRPDQAEWTVAQLPCTGGGPCLWFREWDGTDLSIPKGDHSIRSVSLVLTPADGSPLMTIDSPAAFFAAIKELWYIQ